jgi:methylmalonyl-CoA mutase
MPGTPDLSAGELPLAAEFPAPTRRDWQRLVARVLHGPAASLDDDADPERELATLTLDGIEIAPLYTADDAIGSAGYPGQAPFVRGRTVGGHRTGWDIRGRYSHPDPAAAREQIMTDLEGGVSSLWLEAGDGTIPVEAIPDVLAEVYLDLATVVLDAGEYAGAAARIFLDEARRRGIAGGELKAVLGVDPIGLLARTGLDTGTGGAGTGGAGTGKDTGMDQAAALAARCAAGLPGVRAIVADALPFHDAGGTDATELGCALAAGVEYVRALAETGLPMAAAFGQLEFRFAATADQFATIAKLRAARRTWSRVAGQCGVSGEAAGQRQHAVSSWPMMTRRDPWNNILRGTLACFAAGTGGAGAITVLPFDAALGLPDALALRVARNTHALLAEESHVARVIDPAGGSWYVESLTEALAQRAWAWFQEIERAGGLRAAIRSGMVADRIAANREARCASLAHRREAVTGVSEFPMIGETLLQRPQASVRPRAGGLPRIRWAQWHEELRDRADAYTQSSGAPPTVALVLVGAPRAAASRAAAVTALLAPAGIATVTASMAADATGQGERVHQVAVVCCADDASENDASAAVERLRAAGASLVMLTPDTGPAGADEIITDGIDVLALQRRTLDALGVPE